MPLSLKRSQTRPMRPQYPLALPKNEEKYREGILDRIEEGGQGKEWLIIMPQVVNEILQKNLTTTRTPIATRTSHATDGIQWIRMEELGKALTNRCRAVRALKIRNRRRRVGLETDSPTVNNLNSSAD